jgi:hypothetical protein
MAGSRWLLTACQQHGAYGRSVAMILAAKRQLDVAFPLRLGPTARTALGRPLDPTDDACHPIHA